MTGIICFRAPSRATQDQIDELKDHIAALNAQMGYLSPTGRVETSTPMVDPETGIRRTLEFVATKVKTKHMMEVEGTGYDYKVLGKVAGHLPDTTWSGKTSPFCWHQQNGRVNSNVGGDAQKYLPGYKPTGFYYAGVKNQPATYTTERVTGSVERGEYGICEITRP